MEVRMRLECPLWISLLRFFLKLNCELDSLFCRMKTVQIRRQLPGKVLVLNAFIPLGFPSPDLEMNFINWWPKGRKEYDEK